MALLLEKINHAFNLFEKGHLSEAEALYNECLSEVSKTDEYVQILHGLGYIKTTKKI